MQIDATLARAERKEQHHQHGESQGQERGQSPAAPVVPPWTPQPKEQSGQGQPECRDDLDEVVVPRPQVVPCGRITLDGLLEQQLVAVGLQRRITRRRDPQEHRHQPRGDHRDEGQQRQQHVHGALRPGRRNALQPGTGETSRQQPSERPEQEREEAHGLGDDAESCGCATEQHPCGAGRLEQVAPECPERQRDPEHQGRIDLRTARDLHELHAAGECDGGGQPSLSTMQPPTEVVDEQQGPERRDHRGHQKCPTQVVRQLQARGDQPEMQRRLVLIEIAADPRDEPIAGTQHVERDRSETRLIGRPGIAQTEADADECEECEPDPGEVSPPRLTVDGHSSTFWRPERMRYRLRR